MDNPDHFKNSDGNYDKEAIVSFLKVYNSRSKCDPYLVAQNLFAQARFLGISTPPITQQIDEPK